MHAMPTHAIDSACHMLMLQVLEFESQYLDALPSAQMYERSFMHREAVTQATVSLISQGLKPMSWNACTFSCHVDDTLTMHRQATSSDFFITGSIDGFVKFWKKQPIGIEFVKMYRSHLGPVDGELIDCDAFGTTS